MSIYQSQKDYLRHQLRKVFFGFDIDWEYELKD